MIFLSMSWELIMVVRTRLWLPLISTLDVAGLDRQGTSKKEIPILGISYQGRLKFQKSDLSKWFF